MIDNSYQNSLLNFVHECNEPDQPFVTKFFFTRVVTVFYLPFELFSLFTSTISLSFKTEDEIVKLSKRVITKVIPFLIPQDRPRINFFSPIKISEVSPLKRPFLKLCCLIAGIASTIIIGAVISPELNFQIHIEMGLATDILAVKKQKREQSNADAISKIAEIEEERANKINAFEEKKQRDKKLQQESVMLDPTVADRYMQEMIASMPLDEAVL